MKKFCVLLSCICMGGAILGCSEQNDIATQAVPVQEDISAQEMYDELFKDKFCFASWSPHGMFWQDICTDTMQECEAYLQERIEIVGESGVNTTKCYTPYLTDAWCIDHIKTGYKRYYDDFDSDTYYDDVTIVCTQTQEKCQELKQYQRNDHESDCEKLTVLSHHTESGYYLWRDKEIESLINKNKTQAK
ncbi:MAG: hypothetical protein J5613_00235 [Alphaproteobacteria bacterium]|nr:hypothetical protein [Alphaproteobacteria bacterium]